ncbi:MAG: 2-methylcitrate dehydratase [Polaromonas sp.]|nr:2-methylcitrate dehydratase [Polaromonas sp.]
MTVASDPLDRLARFVGQTPAEAIPEPVLQRTREILVDSLPVLAWGMRTPELVALSDAQIRSGAPGKSWVIGKGCTTNRFDAAMLNGIAGAWLDYDEGNFLANGHPGMQVIPASLALGQEIGASGKSVLATIALAYEAVARIGMATKIKLIINPHGTFGVVGAALATARLSGMAPGKLRGLASLAASTCMATNRHTMLDGATVRNWYAGHSGFMGQMAARLAESGFSGPSDGVNTTFSLVLGDGFSWDKALGGLGERWLLTEGYLKLYPTARYVHSCIDALFDALAQSPQTVAVEDVERVEIKAYRLAAYLSNQTPKDWFGTRFSLPFAVATLMVGGRNGLEAFSDRAVADPKVMALASRVDVVEHAPYTATYPDDQRVMLVLHLRGGRQLVGECHITSGEPTRPHAAADLERKYRDLAYPLWGASRANQLRDALLGIDSCPNVQHLVDFFP